jgi:hypothetical protein
MIIAENKLGISTYNKDEKTLVSVYKGRVNIHLALEHLAKIAAFYKENEVFGAIVDIKEVYGSFAKIFGYMKETLNPAAVKSGLKCQVFVLSEDLIVKNLGIKLKEMAEYFHFKTKVFSDRKEAEVWVKKTLMN